jgi:hypothetical protein
MWLVYREKADGCTILHGSNGSEYRLPDLSHLSVDGFCPETKIVWVLWVFLAWSYLSTLPRRHYRGWRNLSRKIWTHNGKNRADHAGCLWNWIYVRMWLRCGNLSSPSWIEDTPCSTTQSSEHSRCIVRGSNEGYGTALQDTRGETIRYCDIMSLYTHSCKYFKFPLGHPVIHVGDACQDIEIVL